MSWEIIYNPDLHIVQATFYGQVDGQELKSIISECIAIGAREQTWRFIIDVIQADLKASLAELYMIPARQFDAEGLNRESRIALIQPRSDDAKFAIRFYENACRKRDWNVQMFSDRDAALKWLD